MTTTLTTYSAEDYPQRSEQWHELRLGMVTASVIGRLVTPTLKVASNDDSRKLTDALAAQRITGYDDDPTYQNLDMWRGQVEEPRARDKYAEDRGVVVEEVGFMVRAGRDGWKLGCSPDGLVGLEGGIEVKCPRAKTHLRTILNDEVPSQYMPQIQASLLVSGRRWWDFISWSGGLPMYVKRVLPDEQWFAAIEEAVALVEERIELTASEFTLATADLPMTERLELVVI